MGHDTPCALFSAGRGRLNRRPFVDTLCLANYTAIMELDLSPELQAKLDEVATQRGRDAKSLVKEAVERLVDYDAWFVREVEKGLAEIERGDVLEHNEVGARLEKSLSNKQRRL